MIPGYRLKKFLVRVLRGKHPPEYIARGWALGTCVGFAVPFGMQLYIAVPLSFLFRSSKIGATLGTLVTNPFSILFIYPAQCWLGSRLLGKDMEWAGIANELRHVMEMQDWSSLLHLSKALIVSFFVGGILFAAVMTPLAYYFTLYAARRYRESRARMRAMRKERARQFMARLFKERRGRPEAAAND